MPESILGCRYRRLHLHPLRHDRLLDCVNENANVTIVISDNETTAMTADRIQPEPAVSKLSVQVSA